MSGETSGAEPQPLDDWFLEMLSCPGCEQHLPVTLEGTDRVFLCACGKYSFPINALGIPILVVEEATVLNPNARPEDVDKA